jgi:hypothetical protein
MMDRSHLSQPFHRLFNFITDKIYLDTLQVDFILFELVVALVLQGSVAASSSPGRVGITWDALTHRVLRVHTGSPSDHVLEPGDHIIKVTDLEGSSVDLIGPSGEEIIVTVRRGGQVLIFHIVREPWPWKIQSKDRYIDCDSYILEIKD